MPIPAWLGYGLISGGISGLAGYLGAESQRGTRREERAYLTQKEADDRAYAERIAREKRERAGGILGEGYGYTPYGQTYTPYASPFAGATEATLSQFLSGKLTPAQEAAIAKQRELGEGSISRRAATYGTPGGAVAGLSTRLSSDIALRAAQLSGEQQKFGVQAVLPYEAARLVEKSNLVMKRDLLNG